MTERTIEVPGGRLEVHDFGAGPAVVLLHAGIVDSWAWEPLTPLLLDAGYRVVAFDRRGTGGSTTEDVPYSNRADTIAVIDALDLGQAALVGNSIGGQVATDTAIEFPDRVAALVAIGSIVPNWWPGMTAAEEAVEAELERVAESGDAQAIADADVRAGVDGPGQPTDRVPEDIRELVREMGLAIQTATADRGDPGSPIPLDPPASERLERLTMPVLAVCGALDFSYHVKSAEYLAANVTHGRVAILPDVAHLPGLEAPEELGALLVEFLAPLPRWR